jgi:Peptidase M15
MRLLFIFFLITSCTEQVNSPPGEPITRLANTKEYRLEPPEKSPPPAYPWVKNSLSPVTKYYFRCKGCSANPPHTYEGETIKDCGGFHKHSLPIKDKKEFIYPILITLLNHIQTATGHKVIVTSGHRCPKHNTYLDPTTNNQTSKHLIGAEVDFYVEGMENNPQAIVEIIQDYYKGTEFASFKRFEGKTNVSNPPWSNKEIFIKLFKSDEGRNCDNTHPHPYLSIQVRYDMELKEPVTYTWAKANRGYYQK